MEICSVCLHKNINNQMNFTNELSQAKRYCESLKVVNEVRDHIMKTASVDNWSSHVIIPIDVYKEALEAYNKSVGDTDLEILDKLAEIPTKEEMNNADSKK